MSFLHFWVTKVPVFFAKHFWNYKFVKSCIRFLMTGTKPSFSALVSFRNTNRGLLAKTYEHFKPLVSGIENFTFNHLCVKKSCFGIFVAFTYSNTVRWSSSQSGLRYPIQSNSTLPLLLWSFWDASDLCRTLRSKVMSIF